MWRFWLIALSLSIYRYYTSINTIQSVSESDPPPARPTTDGGGTPRPPERSGYDRRHRSQLRQITRRSTVIYRRAGHRTTYRTSDNAIPSPVSRKCPPPPPRLESRQQSSRAAEMGAEEQLETCQIVTIQSGGNTTSLFERCQASLVQLRSGGVSPVRSGQVRSGQVRSRVPAHLFLYSGRPVGVRVATLQFLANSAPHRQRVLVAALNTCTGRPWHISEKYTIAANSMEYLQDTNI